MAFPVQMYILTVWFLYWSTILESLEGDFTRMNGMPAHLSQIVINGLTVFTWLINRVTSNCIHLVKESLLCHLGSTAHFHWRHLGFTGSGVGHMCLAGLCDVGTWCFNRCGLLGRGLGGSVWRLSGGGGYIAGIYFLYVCNLINNKDVTCNNKGNIVKLYYSYCQS